MEVGHKNHYVEQMGKEKIISILEMMKPLLQAEGVAHLDIFGSQARGDATPESDLDILVEPIQTGVRHWRTLSTCLAFMQLAVSIWIAKGSCF